MTQQIATPSTPSLALEPHLAPELARLTLARGLAVTALDGSVRPIPVTATPVIIASTELARRMADSASLASATVKMAEAAVGGLAAYVVEEALSPLEREVCRNTHQLTSRLATTRVDYFVSQGRPRALEINATIPAMQAYSDIAAHSFIEVMGRAAGLDAARIDRLIAQNGSNARALHQALMRGYAQAHRDEAALPARMAILVRRNDAQISEIRWLQARFTEWGTPCDVVYPDELSGTDRLTAHGHEYDLLYRHLFVRRLEEHPASYVADLFAGRVRPRLVMLNPPASQVEVKGVFSLLSRALVEGDLAEGAHLDAVEMDAIARLVPWTRLLRRGPAVDPDGRACIDLVERVAADPQRFVLKRSWDYGGKTVFVGASVGTPSFDDRVRAVFGEPLGWPEVVARAAEDRKGGGMVAQELVENPPEQHLLCHEDGVQPLDLFVDFSAYASVGLGDSSTLGWGGVCRGSSSRIVNIVGGGGVLPLLTDQVAQALLSGLQARRPPVP